MWNAYQQAEPLLEGSTGVSRILWRTVRMAFSSSLPEIVAVLDSSEEFQEKARDVVKRLAEDMGFMVLLPLNDEEDSVSQLAAQEGEGESNGP